MSQHPRDLSQRQAAIGTPCAWCGRKMVAHDPFRAPTRDHVHPKSRRWGDQSNRIVWACYACNQMKGDMSLDAWRRVMEEVPEWWRLAEKRGPRGRQLHQAMIECGFAMPHCPMFV